MNRKGNPEIFKHQSVLNISEASSYLGISEEQLEKEFEEYSGKKIANQLFFIFSKLYKLKAKI